MHVGAATSVNVITGDASQLSVAEAVPVLPGNVFDVHSIVTSAGQVTTGGVLSSTVITCRHVLEFPHSSVALHVRFILYSWIQAGSEIVASV